MTSHRTLELLPHPSRAFSRSSHTRRLEHPVPHVAGLILLALATATLSGL